VTNLARVPFVFCVYGIPVLLSSDTSSFVTRSFQLISTLL